MNQTPRKRRPLALRRETLRVLTTQQLSRVAGAIGQSHPGYMCSTPIDGCFDSERGCPTNWDVCE